MLIDQKKLMLDEIHSHIHTMQSIDDELLSGVEQAVDVLVDTLNGGGAVYVMGNGGSAGDAQHFVAEMVGRFMMERAPLRFFALSTNTSILTAIGNDYTYDHVFTRQVQAAVRPNDTVIGISTSGNSGNVLKALEAAKEMQCKVIGFTGSDGGKMRFLCDVLLNVPSNSTPRIQEVHILLIHIICNLLEKRLFA